MKTAAPVCKTPRTRENIASGTRRNKLHILLRRRQVRSIRAQNMLERASIVVPENFHSGIQSWRSIVMRIRTTALLLVTGSIGLAFAGSASAASCGTYGGYDPKPPPESVTITAPRVQ